MSMTDPMNQLLLQEPHKVLQWLREILAEERDFPEDFNWRGLAECAATDACARASNAYRPNLDWAYVAALAYTYLIQWEQNSSHLAHKPELKKNLYRSYNLKLMQVQVNAILAFGPARGDPIRDVDQLAQSFLDGISLSPADWLTASLSPKKERSFAERMELHWLWQRLRVLKPLEEKCLLPAHQDLALWFAAWDRLLAQHKQPDKL